MSSLILSDSRFIPIVLMNGSNLLNLEKKIYIIRHGETEYNKRKMMQGRSINIGLNDKGKKQAASFYKSYQNTGFEVVITSDLIRSQETVLNFIDDNIPHIIDKRISEISWGKSEGKPINDEILNAYELMLKEWANGNLEYSIEGGESGKSLMNRIDSFIKYLKTLNYKTILICTHGRAMRMLVTRLQNLPIVDMETFEHSNTGLYLFEQKKSNFKMLKNNNTEHLLG